MISLRFLDLCSKLRFGFRFGVELVHIRIAVLPRDIKCAKLSSQMRVEIPEVFEVLKISPFSEL